MRALSCGPSQGAPYHHPVRDTAGDDAEPILRVELTTSADRHDLVLEGELDLDSSSLLDEQLPDVADDRVLHVDLSAVTFVDSAGIRALVRLLDGDRRVLLCQASQRVRRTFELANLAHLLDPAGS